MMDGRAVKLIIKAPNQQIKDQVIQCDVGWSIGRLKEYLSEVYPSKPESKSQKLIYSGQLLNDSIYLRDVLRQCSDSEEDQSYTVHLVCAPLKTNVKTVPPKVPVAQNEAASVAASATAAETVTINSASNMSNQNIDSGNVQAQTAQAQLFSTQYFDPHNNQQMAWMQQAYTHYFTQYMQLMAARGIQLQTSIPYIQHMNTNSNESGQNHYTNNGNNNNGEEPMQIHAAAYENLEDVDGGGDEGALNQDWLDVFYMFSRILLFFSIVYFYSSPLRFFIVTFLGFVIYLYQGGFVRIQPAVQENNNVRADNNNQIGQHEANDAQQGATLPDNEQSQTGQNEARTNANVVEERPGALAFAWTFLSSFFASLIPDEPNI